MFRIKFPLKTTTLLLCLPPCTVADASSMTENGDGSYTNIDVCGSPTRDHRVFGGPNAESALANPPKPFQCVSDTCHQ